MRRARVTSRAGHRRIERMVSNPSLPVLFYRDVRGRAVGVYDRVAHHGPATAGDGAAARNGPLPVRGEPIVTLYRLDAHGAIFTPYPAISPPVIYITAAPPQSVV